MSALRTILGSCGPLVIGLDAAATGLIARNLGPGEAFVRLNALGNKLQEEALDAWWHLPAGTETGLASFDYLAGKLRRFGSTDTPQAALLEQVLAHTVPFILQFETVTPQGAGVVTTPPLQFRGHRRGDTKPVAFELARGAGR